MSVNVSYTPEEEQAMRKELNALMRRSYQRLSKDDKKLILRAFDTAKEAHKHQRRKSGEAYMFHPLAVARIVSERIGLGAISIAAALLHDTVEDTELSIDDIRLHFGDKIAQIVEGLTKIQNIPVNQHDEQSIQAENFRKLILTLNEDVRVVLIKIADRLHNLQTLGSMRRDKQEKIASETLYIYAPLAHRFGLYDIKTELEDLSLKYLEPDKYREIKQKLAETEKQRKKYIRRFIRLIDEQLRETGLEYSITGRPKSIYSIYRKMKTKHVDFDEIYDIYAIRVIYKGYPDDIEKDRELAWMPLASIVTRFQQNENRMRNWVNNPKSTGYEALHITVKGPENKWVEIQIRSERMNEIAEKGYAAHYKYKQGRDETEELGIDRWLNQLQEILNEPVANTTELLDDIRLNLYSDEINVLTPKGDVVSLPKGATALDFAYYIHTDVGKHTRAARVNGRIVPLNHVLNSGDTVEIITSANQYPKHSWLNLTVTGRARSKIRSFLRQQENQVIEEGKEILKRKLRHLKLDYNEKNINALQKYFKLKNSRDLFYKIGIGEITNDKLKAFAKTQSNVFLKLLQNPWPRRAKEPAKRKKPVQDDTAPNYDLIVFGPEDQRLDYTLANCCNPLPGDDIFGFVTVNEGIKVHKKTCPNAINLQSRYAHRIMVARWVDSSRQEFKVNLRITGADRPGIVADVTDLVSRRMGFKMRHVDFDDNNGVFEGRITVFLKNTAQLKELMLRLREIEGVEKVVKI